MKSFAGKVVLITGSKSAIGKATAIKFADLGARVAIVGRDMAGLTATAKEIGSDVFPIQCDVTSSQDVNNAVAATISKFGGLDILFNNSGVLVNALIADMDETEFDRVQKPIFTACSMASSMPHRRSPDVAAARSSTMHQLADCSALPTWRPTVRQRQASSISRVARRWNFAHKIFVSTAFYPESWIHQWPVVAKRPMPRCKTRQTQW